PRPRRTAFPAAPSNQASRQRPAARRTRPRGHPYLEPPRTATPAVPGLVQPPRRPTVRHWLLTQARSRPELGGRPSERSGRHFTAPIRKVAPFTACPTSAALAVTAIDGIESWRRP